jgi:hypothetical protein
MTGEARSAASAMKLAGVIVVCIGLAAFAVVLWILRKAMGLQRAWDIGDFWVLGVLALFAAACAWWGGQLFRRAPASTPEPAAIAAAPAPEAATRPPRRVTVSHGFSATGVILLILSVLLPDEWHPVMLLLVGLACLVVSHALTPCEERMEKLRKARASTRQL